MDYGWKVHHDLCCSNHFPIVLEILQPLHDERLPHWKLNKANWEVFQTLCVQKLFQGPNTTDQKKVFYWNININSKNFNLEQKEHKHSTEKLSAYVRLPYVNSVNNTSPLISMTSNSSGQEYENSLRKPKRKVGKTISTNWAPIPKPTQSGGWLGKSSENPNQPPSNTSQKTDRSNYKKRHRSTSQDIFRKFFSQKLQSTIHFLQRQIRATKTWF